MSGNSLWLRTTCLGFISVLLQGSSDRPIAVDEQLLLNLADLDLDVSQKHNSRMLASRSSIINVTAPMKARASAFKRSASEAPIPERSISVPEIRPFYGTPSNYRRVSAIKTDSSAPPSNAYRALRSMSSPRVIPAPIPPVALLAPAVLPPAAPSDWPSFSEARSLFERRPTRPTAQMRPRTPEVVKPRLLRAASRPGRVDFADDSGQPLKPSQLVGLRTPQQVQSFRRKLQYLKDSPRDVSDDSHIRPSISRPQNDIQVMLIRMGLAEPEPEPPKPVSRIVAAARAEIERRKH